MCRELVLLGLVGLAAAAPSVQDAQVLVQAHLYQQQQNGTNGTIQESTDAIEGTVQEGTDAVEEMPPWPDCQQAGVRIRSGDGMIGGVTTELIADLTDYGAIDGCSANDCSDSDEMSLADMAACALVCATTTNCKFWTWGMEASKTKCWLRSIDTDKTTVPAEAEGFVSGTVDCRPSADFSAIHDHPVTGQVITFHGQDCPSGPSATNLNGKDFLMLGRSHDKPYYYNKDAKLWLYYDLNCNGKSGDEGWMPHWVITPKPPQLAGQAADKDRDGICEAMAYTSLEGDEFGPTPSGWQVDCDAKGLTTKTLAMDIMRHGMFAEFYKVDAASLDSFVPTGADPTIARIDPRIDYWVTTNPWKDMPNEFTGSYYAKWNGYLKIAMPGDYYFSIGTSDIAFLEWHHAETNSWATYKHNGEGTFTYSSMDDYTPETVRALESGFHRFRVRYWRKYEGAQGLVLKYKGTDSNNTWKVIPYEVLFVKPPGCVAPGYPEPVCEEGFIIAPGENCTVINALACPEGQIAAPLTCVPPNLLKPICQVSPESLAKQKAEEAAKAEAEQKDKAEAEQKEKAEGEQKDKAAAELEAEEEQKAKADAEAQQKADAANRPEPPVPGKSISKWR